MITSQTSWGIWELTGSQGENLSSFAENKSQRNGTSSSKDKSVCQDGANASGSSWGELEPHGKRRIDHIGGPTANLELQRSDESELTFPDDQMGSDQRARWDYFTGLKHSSEPEPGQQSWCQWHIEESLDELSSGLNEETVWETALEDQIEKNHSWKLPMLLHY